jgi:hypothetical protein
MSSKLYFYKDYENLVNSLCKVLQVFYLTQALYVYTALWFTVRFLEKTWQVNNTLAYFVALSGTKKKEFYNIDNWSQCYKTFLPVNYELS